MAASPFFSVAESCFHSRISNCDLYISSASYSYAKFNTRRFQTIRNPNFRISSLSMAVKSPRAAMGASSFSFSKYQGTGNDFILVDNRDSTVPVITADKAVELCDRHFGIGADGVILAMPGIYGSDYTMRIFNSDGSEPEMCGNGMRCFAKFISTLDGLNGKKSFTVYTGAGFIIPEIQPDGKVRVNMGEPILKGVDVPTKLPSNSDQSIIKAELDVDGLIWGVTAVSMGNPHCVTFGTKDSQNLEVDEINLAEIGPKFERHVMFPARTNTEFVQVISRSRLKMRVWERGAGATLACGTGACAVVVAAVLEGRTQRSCTVELPGGCLEVEWREDDNRVYLTGPALPVFHGTLPC